MAASPTALDADWLGACRRATEGVREVLLQSPTSAERVRETGEVGEGGDRTLLIDRDAETVIFAELDRLHRAGARFCAVSEERGVVDYGDPNVKVVIDPIDGSLNAKRGLRHHALSIAVADGPLMADVAFGYVFDLGLGEEWWARRGEGAHVGGLRLDDPPPERRDGRGRLELVAIESADPRRLGAAMDKLDGRVKRVRALGVMALSICQVAATRVDGMVSLWRCRSVDVAAAQLVVRESGGLVEFVGYDDPLGAPLDLEPHAPIVAARTPRGLEELASIHRSRA